MEGDITAPSTNRKCSALTGSARKIKDNAADWHNLMLRWDRLSEDGFSVAANIVNMRRSQDGTSSPEAGAAQLQDECSRLQDVVDRMVVMVTKMEHLMTSQRGIVDLEEFQFGPTGRTVPLFHTWNTKRFGSSCEELLQTFRQELRLRQTILQDLAHAEPSDLAMVYLSCWLHQPFTAPQTRLTLEALLLETGHRAL